MKKANKKNMKLVAIYEKAAKGTWKKAENSDEYVFEGVFTKFDIINENNRRYRAKNVMPLIESLKTRVRNNNLLGELDHPDRWDTSLKEASHVIENLEYDSTNNCIKGKIRLLSTPNGEIAKRLVDDGIPLYISSRAAGVVKENKDVDLKQIFTYDIVVTPGFSQAKLNKINESLGISDNVVEIYEASQSMIDYYNLFEQSSSEFFDQEDDEEEYEDSESSDGEEYIEMENSDDNEYESEDEEEYDDDNEEEIKESKNKRKMTKDVNDQFVKVSDLQKYSIVVKNEFDQMYEQLDKISKINESNGNGSIIDDNVSNRIDEFNSNLNKLTTYVKYLATNLDDSISYNNYLANHINEVKESAEKVIAYVSYLGSKTNESLNYTEHVADKVNVLAQHTDKLGKTLNEALNYSDYLAEKTNEALNYANYVGKKTNEIGNYANYVGQKTNEALNYANYVGQKTNEALNYANYVADNINNLNESGPGLKPASLNENNNFTSSNKYLNEQKTIANKIDRLFESVEKRKTERTIDQYNFKQLAFLSESTKQHFEKLTPAEKQKVVNAVNESACTSERDILRVFSTVLNESQSDEFRFIHEMPDQYKPAWEMLSESQKNDIIRQSKFYALKTLPQIKHFWSTRNLEKQFNNSLPTFEMIKESKSSGVTIPKQNNNLPNKVAEEIMRRNRQY